MVVLDIQHDTAHGIGRLKQRPQVAGCTLVVVALVLRWYVQHGLLI